MSDGLFKTRISYGYDASALPLENRMAFLDMRLRVDTWLLDNKRSADLVNTYDNDAQGILFVFSNRDTALMLKLALA